MVALRLARTLIATDAATARSILEEVRHVAMAHPGEPGLARAWADAAGPTVAHLAAVDVEAACGLLDTFEDLARRQPREPKLRERWAAGTEAVIAHLAVADPVRAQSLQRKLEG